MVTKSKSVAAKKRALEAERRFKEAQKEVEKAQQEEKELLESGQKQVEEICNKNQLFCGIILRKEDVISLVTIAIENGGKAIKIPFKLYIDDEEKEEVVEEEVVEE